eukprot:724286-Rhodomonas_salina.2
MCGTDIAYAATCLERPAYPLEGTDIAHSATRCAVRVLPASAIKPLRRAAWYQPPTVLRASYAMSGTDTAHRAMMLRAVRLCCYQLCAYPQGRSTTPPRYHLCYLPTLSGTDMWYHQCFLPMPTVHAVRYLGVVSPTLSPGTDLLFTIMRYPIPKCTMLLQRSTMLLRICYAMSSTELPYAAMRCLLLTYAMLLRICYALSGTDLAAMPLPTIWY